MIQPDGTTGPAILYEDTVTTEYTSRGGRFVMDVNPSTRPLVAGRYGRHPQAPPQSQVTLANPTGVPAEGADESTTFEVQGLPAADNGFAVVSISWPATADPEAQDWDFDVIGPDGLSVGSGATLKNPETIRIPDPKPGTYTVVATNYEGGTVEHDWSGTVSFESPTPPSYTGIKEAWVLSCTDKRGDVVATRQVVVDRGQLVDVGNACKRQKG